MDLCNVKSNIILDVEEDVLKLLSTFIHLVWHFLASIWLSLRYLRYLLIV